ncbi:unnamed protein product [Linum trigynum]|uniref:Uncharacterized protein n=1 Tax=Linum trigynum TaxID=586398 RepID=A0AAV2DDN4_9ROSI
MVVPHANSYHAAAATMPPPDQFPESAKADNNNILSDSKPPLTGRSDARDMVESKKEPRSPIKEYASSAH